MHSRWGAWLGDIQPTAEGGALPRLRDHHQIPFCGFAAVLERLRVPIQAVEER